MRFGEAVKTCMSTKFVEFKGRAQRSEYWWFLLFTWGVAIVLSILDGFIFNSETGFGILGKIWSLVLIFPYIGVGVRRLHDLDKSGWWLLISFIPVIGLIVLIFWFVRKGSDGENRFGSDPLG